MRLKPLDGNVGIRGAAAIQFTSKYANVAVQLVLTAVLARLVSPEDFGVASIVTVVTAFFTTFSDAGIGVAIVQFRDLKERDFGALFVFSLLLGFVLAALFCLAAVPVSVFYGSPDLAPLCCLASVSLFLSTLNMVPNGLMLRERRFVSVGVRLVASTVISGVIGVALAFAGAGAFAVVGQAVALSAVTLVLNLLARPLHEVNPHFMAPLCHVFSYSAWQLGFNAINYFNRNFDNLVLGKVLGTAPLGNYDKAYKLTTYPMSALSSVIASVVQPFMAEHQDDKDLVFDCFMKIEKGLSLVAAPIAVVFFCAPEEIVGIMYGSQWADAIVPFQALGLSVYFQMLGNPTGAFFQSLGRTDLMFRQGLACTCLTVGGLLVGVAFGGLGAVSVCISAGFCLGVAPIAYYLIKRAFGQSLSEMKLFLPEIFTGLIAAAVCFLLSGFFELGLVVSLLVKLMIIAAVFAAGYGLTHQFTYLRAVIGKR